MTRRRVLALAALVAGLAAVVAVVTAPPLRARAKALPLAVEAIGREVPRPFASAVVREEARVGDVVGDLYAGEDSAPSVVLLPGATPAGRDDRRTVTVARALARSGRTVFVPELALYDRRVDEADLERIADAALALPAHRLGQGPVLIVGFSYGGAYGLVAAADPRLADRVVQVATFGAYWDLVGVVQAVTTGASLVDGARFDWNGDPRARQLLAEHALTLAAPEHRETLAAALAGERDPATLHPDAQALHALLTNDDPQATAALAERLGDEAQRILRRFSPARVADDIDAPIVAMHAVDDPAVPYAEARRLQADRPDARLVTVELFSHVDLTGVSIVGALPDLWRTWRFAGWVLAAQEGG